jgi:fructose-bisphosphate aldolase, class II
MPLVNALPLLVDARAQGYAVAAFNADCLPLVRPLIRAAAEERAPIIVQAGPLGLRAMGLEAFAAIVHVEAAAVSIPVGLHLDHGTDLDLVEACLRVGFTSVMLDGSMLSPAENLARTRDTVERARARGAGVEAEVGPIAGSEEGITVDAGAVQGTDPEEAAEFVAGTGVDALAVSVGNVHTQPPALLDLQLDRLARVAARNALPLVLHGGSYSTDDALVGAVRRGVAKVNIANVINRAFVTGARDALAAGASRPAQLLAAAESAVLEAARDRIRLFGSTGRTG